MMGALSGRDPKETLWSVFNVLSQPRGSKGGEDLITLGKLTAVCKELKVIVTYRLQWLSLLSCLSLLCFCCCFATAAVLLLPATHIECRCQRCARSPGIFCRFF